MTIRGWVRRWNQDEGWGVIESPDVTGGAAWTHWSVVQMAGYRELTVGEHVLFEWEPFDQDGYGARATLVLRLGAQDAPVAEPERSGAFASSMRLDIDSPVTADSSLTGLRLPTMTVANDGSPQITSPGGEPPAALIVWPLIRGTGAQIRAQQVIAVHYTGVIWRDGKVFDSSWDEPARVEFQIGAGQVMRGLDEGLVGQQVGSRILLVIPPDLASGASGVGDLIGPHETLIYVVDLLDAR
ncbi:FKBP-type peptidyl-prolyl cis-trans isomerase [Kineosporia sp. NBRC 101731]|uniref:FKBP-type peptidyl-prolyl cis-trans isomerase n=1 Tax=Kineosporia sp. NBRC 101731 TaxID=3032199 RepID=UPI0024A1368D|nr:FKBP-type peptidyl-prolyl cis-trans isomerase [Kineosporia sp. NBRC 101731]GLY31835.1 hypothetical protein Kisp02_52000 [Kineosporia sp. NBRC 101731]